MSGASGGRWDTSQPTVRHRVQAAVWAWCHTAADISRTPRHGDISTTDVNVTRMSGHLAGRLTDTVQAMTRTCPRPVMSSMSPVDMGTCHTL